jgi:hypothetical protein
MPRKERAKKTPYTGYAVLPASKGNALHEGNGKNTFFKKS